MPKLDYDLTETQLNTLHMLDVEIIERGTYWMARKSNNWSCVLAHKRMAFGWPVYTKVRRKHCQTVYDCVTKNINKYEWR